MNPGEACDAVYFVLKGVIAVFVKSGDEEVVIDYLGKGSVIGQYSIVSGESMLFGIKAVMAGGSALLCLDRSTLEKMRMKRHELDQVLLNAEDNIEKLGTPQIDFLMFNDLADEQRKAAGIKPDKSRIRIKKFQRAIRRLILLTRALYKKGRKEFSLGGLIFELTESKEQKSNEPTAWIEIVIN